MGPTRIPYVTVVSSGMTEDGQPASSYASFKLNLVFRVTPLIDFPARRSAKSNMTDENVAICDA